MGSIRPRTRLSGFLPSPWTLYWRGTVKRWKSHAFDMGRAGYVTSPQMFLHITTYSSWVKHGADAR